MKFFLLMYCFSSLFYPAKAVTTRMFKVLDTCARYRIGEIKAIDAAEKGDFTVAEELYNLLKLPYEEQPELEANWFQKRPEWAKHRVGCSMLSCSS